MTLSEYLTIVKVVACAMTFITGLSYFGTGKYDKAIFWLLLSVMARVALL